MFKSFTLLVLIACFFSCNTNHINADIFIVNGEVYNGVDHEPKFESIAIKDDKIVFIGNKESVNISAKKTIDAKGMIVSPGFIDPHTHADRDLNNSDTSHNKPFLFQGVTTVIVGNDGSSFYPISEYKNRYESQGIGTNAVLLAGHGTLRKQVIGKSDKIATAEDILKMKALLKEEMEAGAFGMSTGLYYAPGSYSSTEEVIALAKIVAENDGIYDTHLRDESSYTVGLISAIEEAIEIGRQAKLPIHISHIKCLGADVWHKSNEIIKLIEHSRADGIAVTANQYPYDASSTSLNGAVVPRWAESGGKDSLYIRYAQTPLKNRILEDTRTNIKRRGGADKLLIVKTDNEEYVGKNLLELSKMLHISPEEAVYSILEKSLVKVVSFNMIPEDIIHFMKQPWLVTGSDGNSGHPRKYGTFPRKYRKYVKEDNIIDVATFITNSTYKTAEIFKIPNRGALKEGYFADIIIFDPETFRDIADYNNAFELSEGLEYSIINGSISIQEGEFTKKLNGKVLKK